MSLPILENKVSLIVFRQTLPKGLPETCIFSYTIMSYLKKLIGTVSLNTKQSPTVLASSIISHYLLNIYGESWVWGRIPTNNQKIFLFNKFTSSVINSVRSPFNINLRLITLYQFHLKL